MRRRNHDTRCDVLDTDMDRARVKFFNTLNENRERLSCFMNYYRTFEN
jgi:hypothetical protein